MLERYWPGSGVAESSQTKRTMTKPQYLPGLVQLPLKLEIRSSKS
jgi:hypothetical protein